MKIDFGCGDNIKDGYIGCDIRYNPGVEYVGEAYLIVNHVEENTVDECYSRHFLEHLIYSDAVKTVKAWHKILKVGGIVDIEVPDLEYHMYQFIGGGKFNPSPLKQSITNEQHAMAGFYGWQKEAGQGKDWDIHKWGYTYNSLKELLELHGFGDIKRVAGSPWNLRVKAIKL